MEKCILVATNNPANAEYVFGLRNMFIELNEELAKMGINIAIPPIPGAEMVIGNIYDYAPYILMIDEGRMREYRGTTYVPVTSVTWEVEVTPEIEDVINELLRLDLDKISEALENYETSKILNEFERFTELVEKFGRLVGIDEEILEENMVSWDVLDILALYLGRHEGLPIKFYAQGAAEILGVIDFPEIPVTIKKHGVYKKICLDIPIEKYARD